jgi:hypothetical protein
LGSGKSPGLDATRRALSDLEFEREDEIKDQRRKHEGQVEAAKAALADWKKRCEEAVKQDRSAPPKPANADEPAQFVEPRLFTSDATIERLAQLLQARPQGMLLVLDELAGLFANMSRYSGGQDNGFWLQTWDGKPYIIERVGRPAINLRHLLVGIVGGLQPDKLSEVFKSGADGMPARFLYAWPETPPYRPLTDKMGDSDDNAMTDILDTLSRLGDGGHRKSIPLTKLAREEFERVRRQFYEDMQAYDGREREWLAKAQAQVLRLAVTLVFLRWAISKGEGEEPRAIKACYVKAAAHLVRDYFWPHARAVLRQIGLTQRLSDARRVLRWITSHGRTEVGREEVRREALAQRLNADETEAVIAQLVRGGWLRKRVEKSGPKGGRPMVRWEVNPLLPKG